MMQLLKNQNITKEKNFFYIYYDCYIYYFYYLSLESYFDGDVPCSSYIKWI